MLAALTQRTKRIRLGSAISILTFHDPRRIAETYSMLDMVSGGRLVFGVGSGISRTSSSATEASRRRSASASTRTSTSSSG